MQKLTENFTLEEMTRSAKAEELGVTNLPMGYAAVALVRTAEGLEEVRALVGCAVPVSSGYRCLEVNRALGSKDSSQHRLGEAADITAPKFGTPRQLFEAIRKSKIKFDQVILEVLGHKSWVHISFSSRNRREVRIIDALGDRLYVDP